MRLSSINQPQFANQKERKRKKLNKTKQTKNQVHISVSKVLLILAQTPALQAEGSFVCLFIFHFIFLNLVLCFTMYKSGPLLMI